ncbi:MAG: alpha/beta hydrolase [Calditrichaeota bacterium]|nr:MAG: alpha/beta hydrolase [Calditrichota bacterium]
MKFEFTNSENFKIYGDFFEGKKNAPIIFICHGFKGFKNWGWFPFVAEALGKEGFNVVSFNFSLNGVEEDFENFTNLENFKANTYSREILDLKEVVEFVNSGKLQPELQNLPYGFLGHSRGGGIVILASKILKPKSVVTWASIESVVRFSENDINNFKTKGFTEVLNGRTNQIMPLGKNHYEDALEIQKNGDVKETLRKLEIPVRLIHGENDLAVKLEKGKELAANLPKNKSDFKIIKNAGHTFESGHPFKGTSKELTQAIKLTTEFFKSMNS